MSKLREQSIKTHHLNLIDKINHSLSDPVFKGHPYSLRWSPNHAIRADRPDMSRKFLLNLNFLFQFLVDHSRRHVAQKLWERIGPPDWGKLYLQSTDSAAVLADNQGELFKLISLIDFLKGAGFFSESLELAEDVEASLSERPLNDEELIFIFQSCFAKVLAEIGQFDRAEELLHSVLAGRQSRLESMQGSIVESQANLSDVKVALGKYDEALILRRECLRLTEDFFGSNDSRTLTSLNALAMLQHNLGLREESLATYRRVISERERILGDQHPSVWDSKQNLAVLLTELDQFDEATMLLEEAMNHSLQIRGDNDPITIAITNNLAVLAIAAGDYPRSTPLLVSVAHWQEKHRSSVHIDVLLTKNNLARSLEGEGKLSAAEAIYRQVVKEIMAEYGTSHPKTPDIVINLAGLLDDQNQYDEAIYYYRLAVDGYSKNFGLYDYRTLNAHQMLGVCLRESGKLDEAVDILSRLQKYCEDGSNRLAAVSNALGLSFQLANNFSGASREFLKSLAIREELAARGEISSDDVCQVLRRIKALLELFSDESLEQFLRKKLVEWTECQLTD